MRDGGSGGEMWATPFPLRLCIPDEIGLGERWETSSKYLLPFAG